MYWLSVSDNPVIIQRYESDRQRLVAQFVAQKIQNGNFGKRQKLFYCFSRKMREVTKTSLPKIQAEENRSLHRLKDCSETGQARE